MLTFEELEKYGFKEYPVGQHSKQTKNFQYRIREDGVTKFFVNVRYWEFNFGDHRSFDAEVQFNIMSSDDTFNVCLLNCNNKTPEQIVYWFRQIFDRMECRDYDS